MRGAVAAPRRGRTQGGVGRPRGHHASEFHVRRLASAAEVSPGRAAPGGQGPRRGGRGLRRRRAPCARLGPGHRARAGPPHLPFRPEVTARRGPRAGTPGGQGANRRSGSGARAPEGPRRIRAAATRSQPAATGLIRRRRPYALSPCLSRQAWPWAVSPSPFSSGPGWVSAPTLVLLAPGSSCSWFGVGGGGACLHLSGLSSAAAEGWMGRSRARTALRGRRDERDEQDSTASTLHRDPALAAASARQLFLIIVRLGRRRAAALPRQRAPPPGGGGRRGGAALPAYGRPLLGRRSSPGCPGYKNRNGQRWEVIGFSFSLLWAEVWENPETA